MEYMTKREQFEDGMKVEFEHDGAVREGEIVVESDDFIHLCQNVVSGGKPHELKNKNNRGYDYGWILFNDDEYVTDYPEFKIRPRNQNQKKPKKYNFNSKYELDGEPFDVEKRKKELAELVKKRDRLNKDIANRRNEIRAFERWVNK